MSLLLKWPLVVTRLALLATPLLAATYSLDAEAAPLAVAGVLAAWALPMSQALPVDAEPRHDGILADVLVLLLVGVRTLQGLQQASLDTTRDWVWLAPLLVALLHTCLIHIDQETEGTPVFDRRGLVLMMMVRAVCGAMLAYLARDATSQILFAAETALGLVLVLQLRSVTHAASDSVRALVYLDAAAFLVYEDDAWVLHAVLPVATGVLALVALHTHTAVYTRVQRVARVLVTPVRAALDGVCALLASPLPYEMAFLVSGIVLAASLNKVWYTSHSTFPDTIATPARVGKSFIDDYVRVFYEFTSDATFQRTIAIAVPEFGQLRGVVNRVVRTSYRPLRMAADGVSASFVPSESLAAIVCLVPIAVVWAATVIQVVPEGMAYVKSKWFWALGAVVSLVSFVQLHVASDTSVSLWNFVLDDIDYTRTYTQTGRIAVAAHLVLGAACVALFVLRAAQARRHGKPRVGGRLIVNKCRDVVTYLSGGALLLTAVAVLILVATASSTGSPVESYRVVKYDTHLTPAWLVSTPIDKAGALITGSGMLTKLLTGDLRLAFLFAQLQRYIFQKLGCWGCVCLDTYIDFAEDTFGFVSDLNPFPSRRRLLEHKPTTTHIGSHALRLPRRRVLQDEEYICTHDDTCDTKRVCLSDVVNQYQEKILELAVLGLTTAAKLVAEQILARIPLVARLMDLLDRLNELDVYLDYDLFRLPEVRLGVRLGWTLPSLPKPSLPTLSGALIVVLVCSVAGLFFAYQFGVLVPLLEAGVDAFEVSVIILVATTLMCAVTLVFFLRDELRAEGYDIRVTWHANVYAYGVAFGLLVVALFLRIGEHPTPSVYEVLPTPKSQPKKRQVEA